MKPPTLKKQAIRFGTAAIMFGTLHVQDVSASSFSEVNPSAVAADDPQVFSFQGQDTETRYQIMVGGSCKAGPGDRTDCIYSGFSIPEDRMGRVADHPMQYLAKSYNNNGMLFEVYASFTSS